MILNGKLHPLTLEGEALLKMYDARDDIERHLLDQLKTALAEVERLADIADSAQDALEEESAELESANEKLEALRNVLDELGIPCKPVDIRVALTDADRLARMLAGALGA